MLDPDDDEWAFAGACDAPGRFYGPCVGHRVLIDAPPEIVWDVLIDYPHWPDWNPLVTHTRGDLRPGARIEFTSEIEGLKPRKGSGIVVRTDAPSLIEYRGTLLGGVLRTFRFVEIEELLPTRCRVANGQIFGGPAGRIVAERFGTEVRDGFAAMNAALRARADRLWNRRQS